MKKELCQRHGLTERKVTLLLGENEKKIDFMLISKEHCFLLN